MTETELHEALFSLSEMVIKLALVQAKLCTRIGELESQRSKYFPIHRMNEPRGDDGQT